jgi:hypothetical protein
MQRLAVIAKLKPEAESRAGEMIEKGPPFNPKDLGFERHSVFLGGDHVVFVFEGGRLEPMLHGMLRDPSSAGALQAWDPIIEGMPKVTREVYHWQRGDEWPEGWGE